MGTIVASAAAAGVVPDGGGYHGKPGVSVAYVSRNVPFPTSYQRPLQHHWSVPSKATCLPAVPDLGAKNPIWNGWQEAVCGLR